MGWDTGQDGAQGWQQVNASRHFVLVNDGPLPRGQEELYLLHLECVQAWFSPRSLLLSLLPLLLSDLW